MNIKVTIIGPEINFDYQIFKKISARDKILEEIDEFLEHPETSAYLLDEWEFDYDEIDVSNFDPEGEVQFKGEFIKLKDDEFAIVYYYIYDDAVYSMNIDDEKYILVENKSLCDYIFTTQIKQDDEKIMLNFIEAGEDAYPEILIITKNECFQTGLDIDKIKETLIKNEIV